MSHEGAITEHESKFSKGYINKDLSQELMPFSVYDFSKIIGKVDGKPYSLQSIADSSYHLLSHFHFGDTPPLSKDSIWITSRDRSYGESVSSNSSDFTIDYIKNKETNNLLKIETNTFEYVPKRAVRNGSAKEKALFMASQDGYPLFYLNNPCAPINILYDLTSNTMSSEIDETVAPIVTNLYYLSDTYDLIEVDGEDQSSAKTIEEKIQDCVLNLKLTPIANNNENKRVSDVYIKSELFVEKVSDNTRSDFLYRVDFKEDETKYKVNDENNNGTTDGLKNIYATKKVDLGIEIKKYLKNENNIEVLNDDESPKYIWVDKSLRTFTTYKRDVILNSCIYIRLSEKMYQKLNSSQ